MTDLSFFDCHCMIGRFTAPESGMVFSVDEIARELEYCAIDEALVFHALAKEYSPAIGNARLLEEIRDHMAM